MNKNKNKWKGMKIYHVFTDNNDDWVNTEEEAYKIIKEWKQKGYCNFRVYVEMYVDYDMVYEDCIYSVGSYPY